MSLVGGGGGPVRPLLDETLLTVMGDIARGGKEYADRLDEFKRLKQEALDATDRYGKGAEIDTTLATARDSRKQAEDLLIAAKRHADELVEAAQKKVQELIGAAQAEVAIAKDRLAEVTRERQATVKQLEDLQEQAKQLLANTEAKAAGILANATAVGERILVLRDEATKERNEASRLNKEAEAKLERINAALRA